MRVNNSKLLIVAIILFTLSCFSIESAQTHVAPQYVLETNDSFEMTWNLSGIGVIPNRRRSNLVGVPGKIVIHGWKTSDAQDLQDLQTSKAKVIGLDSLTGNTVWMVNGAQVSEIISNGENVYGGTYGIVTVRSYNIQNGKLLWQTLLPTAHSTSDIYFAENKIFVHTNDAEFYILNDQGEVLDSFSEILDTFLEKDGVLYMSDVSAIKAVDFSSKKELWRLELGMDIGYAYAPIFDNGTIFLNTSDVPAYIYSIDQDTGEVNWKATQGVLSNLYVTEDKIYFLNPDSRLVALDKYSGDELINVKFSPPFNLSDQSGSYFISGDPTNNILAVYFGDNSQIMGLKIKEP